MVKVIFLLLIRSTNGLVMRSEGVLLACSVVLSTVCCILGFFLRHNCELSSSLPAPTPPPSTGCQGLAGIHIRQGVECPSSLAIALCFCFSAGCELQSSVVPVGWSISMIFLHRKFVVRHLHELHVLKSTSLLKLLTCKLFSLVSRSKSS